MKPETFTEILETYGSKPEDWPEASRAACQRLVAQDAHAKGLLDQFERLAVGLDSLEPPSFEGLENASPINPYHQRGRSLLKV